MQNIKKIYNNQIESLDNNNSIVIMDFRQNFKIDGGPIEITRNFYNKKFLSLLSFYMIAKEKKPNPKKVF